MSRAALPSLAVLAVLAAALGGTLAWELRGGEGEALPGLRPAPGEPAAALAGAAVASRGGGWAEGLLARPLFSPERRPPGPGAAAPAAAETPLPRLAGILVTPEGRSAIFAGRPQPLVVREGGMVGRFSVYRIEPGMVTLAGAEGLRVLRPSFDTAAPGARPQGGPVQAGPVAAPALTLPGMRPVLGGEPPPIPGTSPSLAEAPQDGMPFESIPSPSGLDIIRDQARRQASGAGSPGPGPGR